MSADHVAAKAKLPFKAKDVFSKLNDLTTAANGLPAAEADKGDYEYYTTSSREFRQRMAQLGADVLVLNNALLKHQRPLGPTQIHSAEELQDRMNEVVDQLDSMFEIADAAFDELKGINNTAKTVPAASSVSPLVLERGGKLAHSASPAQSPNKFTHAQNILRPQLKFEDEIDNADVPFVPFIREKFYSKTPLALEKYDQTRTYFRSLGKTSEVLSVQERIANLGDHLKLSLPTFANPYADEIAHVAHKANAAQTVKEQVFKSLAETPVTWVETEAQFDTLVDLLEGVSEFAVDLEHHDYRSFQGFLCLMQISTRTEDFLVDTLALRAHVSKLAKVFANPNIVKVLHGADSDVAWLQRDFGIYIVNLFDTGQAARVLEYPSFGLAYLLQQFAHVTADKKYQLADWRVRPLPEEMFRYAREDTHYLLYIFDRLRNELITRSNSDGNLFWAAIKRSEEVAGKTYEKERFDPEGAVALFRKYNRSFVPDQVEVLKVLYAWRDITARSEDESVRYVLPNHMLIGLAEMMPPNASAVVAACSPVPPLVRLKATEIAALVHATKQKVIKAPQVVSSLPSFSTLASSSSATTPTKAVASFPPIPSAAPSAKNVSFQESAVPREGRALVQTPVIPKRVVAASSILQSPAKKSSSVFFDDDDEDDDDMDTDATSKAAKTSSLMGNDDGEEEEDEDDEEDSLRRKASAIHASLALTPLYTIPKIEEEATAPKALKSPAVVQQAQEPKQETGDALPIPLSQRKRKVVGDTESAQEETASSSEFPKKTKKEQQPPIEFPSEVTAEDISKIQDKLTAQPEEADEVFDPFRPSSKHRGGRGGSAKSKGFSNRGNRSGTFVVRGNR